MVVVVVCVCVCVCVWVRWRCRSGGRRLVKPARSNRLHKYGSRPAPLNTNQPHKRVRTSAAQRRNTHQG